MSTSSDSELNWRVEHKGFDKYLYMFEHALNTDCTFHVGDHQIGAHRFVVSVASPVFEAMLLADMSEKKTGVINITDISSDTFKSVLRYMYTYQIELNDCEDAMEIYLVADKYQLDDLRVVCEDRIKEDLSPENVWKVTDLAQTLNNQSILDKCAQILQNETQACCKSVQFKTLSEDQLVLLLSQDTLSLDGESSLIGQVERWARAKAVQRGLAGTDSDVREIILARVLPLLRLATLNHTELNMIVNLSDWLSEEEKQVLASKDTENFPEHICNNFQHRNWLHIVKNEISKKNANYPHTKTIDLLILIQDALLVNTRISSLICKLDVTVSKTILINGLVVSAQVNPGLAVANTLETSCTYKENLVATITEGGTVISVTKYQDQASYNSTVSITFPDPVEILADKHYEFHVSTRANNAYYQMPTRSQINCQFYIENDILMNFYTNVKSQNDSLFKSITVSHK